MTKKRTNKEVAELLSNVAAALLVKGENSFRISAYEEAANSISKIGESLKEIWQRKQLNNIPAIGPNIAGHLDELFRTGKVRHFNEVFKGLPEAMFELMKVSGIGPKTALKLCQHLKISAKKNALSKLKEAAQSGKIKDIPGFRVKSEQDILAGLKELSQQNIRIPLFVADAIAQDIIAYLKQNQVVLRADTLGSLRRKQSTVGDIDISVNAKNAKKVIEHFISYPKKTKVVEAGDIKATIVVANRYQVDLMVEPGDSYGSLLQHFTGSKLHNIHLREIALEKGMSLSEHGIKKLKIKNQKLIKFRSEEEFYNYLNMEWIPPELREDQGEIELSQKNKLPKLVELKDIKGDLHLHSNFEFNTSHDLGVDPMKEMAKRALELGYEYLAFSEHNPSVSYHRDEQIISILQKKKALIDKFNYSNNKITQQKLFIFNSLEIDINPLGERGIPDKALDIIDFGIVSVHSSFKMGREAMTKRILSAFIHPKIKILGHPTGRMLERRKEYELDWEKILDFCLKNNKFLEVNAYPMRLDLPDYLIRQAIKYKVKLVINTDSHSLEQMDYMKYGVDEARRGWATAGDIINCLSYNKFVKILKG